ncbi:hypothetical protein RHSIM_Rhsim12G0068900 [Rhododendron simsii]|uniref:F-box domain-containing protein n=1 Tax=Rhododendron simsii TaxID=118357 RepID=A0A834L977_RHOSS|nr:hypothetical protein RHSIM_Rhsim12G0068900 [Rhododendron simsii]
MMKTGSSRYTKNKRTMSSSTSDIISYLPCNVLEKILMCLTLRDAVRTSVLSKRWRHIWTTLPQLVFDNTFYKECTVATRNNLMMTIYQVLLQHRGPILKFTVSLMALESCPQIDQLIHFVSKNGIQELTLYFFNGGPYKLPSSLFSCGDITRLDLFSCVFKPAPGFKGFGNLLCLKLDKVVIAGDTLSSLISACPLLERLTIQRTYFNYLEIVALNLRFVRLSRLYGSICFKNTPHLARVSMHLVLPLVSKDRETSGSVMHSGTFPAVELLELDYYHLKAVVAGGVPNRHPNRLSHLKILKLHIICFEKVDEISMVLCLIRSSPNLEKIKIKISNDSSCYFSMFALDPVPEPLEVQGWSDISLNQLREVEIHRVSGTRPELDFIEVLLAKSPILERLLIKFESEEVSEESRILKELIRFKRLSPDAEITLRNREEFFACTMRKKGSSRITGTKRKMPDSTSDIISHLPGNVLDKILMCLPIQDAVRTSLLSREWRYVWVKLPQLVFDEMFFRDLNKTMHAKLLMIIYKVMFLHRGQIIKFALSLAGLESCSEIDQWILYVSNNDIQDFTLRIWKGKLYKLPSSLYTCSLLKHLSLCSCMLKPPPGFEGFTRLLSLNLDEVEIADDVLSSLISSCPLLEQLTLNNSTSLNSLEVIGPNLKSVCCFSHIRSICFTNTSHLANVSLYLKGAKDGGEISSSVVLLDSIPVIEFLELDFRYVKGLAACGVPTRLPATLNNLKKIVLYDICFDERDEVSVLICLIRSSPNLEKITIHVSSDLFFFFSLFMIVDLDFSELHGCSDVSLNQLRKVDMKNVSGTKLELEFIKLLLEKSLMLETMLIELKAENVAGESRIVEELTRFRRASPQAEMILLRIFDAASSPTFINRSVWRSCVRVLLFAAEARIQTVDGVLHPP